jgi:hypothetical protein
MSRQLAIATTTKTQLLIWSRPSKRNGDEARPPTPRPVPRAGLSHGARKTGKQPGPASAEQMRSVHFHRPNHLEQRLGGDP